eukprot:6299412-Pyramimonas_sp.AAC.1
MSAGRRARYPWCFPAAGQIDEATALVPIRFEANRHRTHPSRALVLLLLGSPTAPGETAQVEEAGGVVVQS